MADLAIETAGLTKRYGMRKLAVRNLDLKVPEGSVYVFLGRNGAGKTTTIRMLMGLLEKTAGSVRVLGMDPERQAVPMKLRVGYVAENQRMYDWMTVGEVVSFCRPFYPTWDDAMQTSLMERFELTPELKLGDLSRGMYGKVALLVALCHQPELLILDDPTSGLDPVVRRQFLQGIIELIHETKRTVFFSTHIVTEVEQVADYVGIMHNGTLLCSMTLEEMKASVRKLRLVFEGAAPRDILPGRVIGREEVGHELVLTVKDYSDAALAEAKRSGAKSVEVVDLNLEDIFVALVSGNNGSTP